MGIFLSRYSYIDKQVKAFLEEWTGMRVKLGVFLTTAVQLADLPRFLRFKLTGELVVERRGYARYFRYLWRPNFKKPGAYFIKPETNFVEWEPLPKDVYEKYLVLRQEALEKIETPENQEIVNFRIILPELQEFVKQTLR